MRHVNDDVPAPSALNPNIPSSFDTIVATATQKDPRARFPDSASLAAALRSTTLPPTDELTGDTRVVSTEAWPFVAHPPRWDPARLGKIVLGVFAVLLMIAAGLVAYRLVSNAELARERREQRAAAEAARIELANYQGTLYQDAQADLEEQGLFPDPEFSLVEGFEEDVVWGQYPEPGVTVEEGDTVTLYVSTGEPPSEDGGDEGDGDGDEEDGPGNSDEAPGKDKKDKDKEEDD
jgi:serine/threonine-protein kinase